MGTRSGFTLNPPTLVLHENSDGRLVVTVTDNALGGVAVTTATVEATLRKSGSPVSGVSDPLSCPHTAAGVYVGIVPDTADLSRNDEVETTIAIDDGPLRAKQYFRKIVVEAA